MDPANEVKANVDEQAVSTSINTLSIADETPVTTVQNEQENVPLECILNIFNFMNKLILIYLQL